MKMLHDYTCSSYVGPELSWNCMVFVGFFMKMISVYMAFLEFLQILWRIKSFQRVLVKTLIFSWCISSYYKVCMKIIHVLTWLLYKHVLMCIQGLHGNHYWIFMISMKTKIGQKRIFMKSTSVSHDSHPNY